MEYAVLISALNREMRFNREFWGSCEMGGWIHIRFTGRPLMYLGTGSQLGIWQTNEAAEGCGNTVFSLVTGKFKGC